MFKWFEQIGDIVSGIDIEAVKKDEETIRKETRQKGLIFSTKARVWIIVLLLIYIAMSAVSIIVSNTGTMIVYIVKSIVMSAVALSTVIALLVRTKVSERISLIGIFVFLFGLFLSITLL